MIQDRTPGEFMVAEFLRTFGASVDPRLWVKLMAEEMEEWDQAHRDYMDALTGDSLYVPNAASALLKETADVLYTTIAMSMLVEDAESLFRFLVGNPEVDRWIAQASESKERMIVSQGIFGAPTIREAFERVHTSNMSKLGKNGKPKRRKDGKILKGPNYKPPVLDDLVADH